MLICLQIGLLAGELLFASVVIDDRVYKATITRDIWGVPHVFGKTDADAAFGIAFAHAQDDIKNLTDNISLYRAEMGLKQGLKGVVSDYLIKALKIREMVVEGYEIKLSSEVREVIEGYVAGLNYWVDLNPSRDYQALHPPSTTRLCPVTNEDAFDARYTAAPAISSGWPTLCIGDFELKLFIYPGRPG